MECFALRAQESGVALQGVEHVGHLGEGLQDGLLVIRGGCDELVLGLALLRLERAAVEQRRGNPAPKFHTLPPAVEQVPAVSAVCEIAAVRSMSG